MLQVLEKVFARNVATPEWQARIRQIVPSYGRRLNDDPEMVAQGWAYTSEQLQLPAPPAIDRAALKPVPVSSTVLDSSDTAVKAPVHDLAP
jgi:malate dehydrogenase (quinone)